MAVGAKLIRQQLKAALFFATPTPGTTLSNGGSLTLTDANTIVGYDDLGAPTQFLSGLSATAPKLYVRGGRLLGIEDDITERPSYAVKLDIYFQVTRDTDSDLTAFEDMLDVIKNRWADGANFSGTKRPRSVTWGEPVVHSKQAPIVIYYEIETETVGC